MDDEFLKEFTDEALELLAGIENDLLAIEEQGDQVDTELINKVFRAAHTIKGGSGFFELEPVTQLAHKSETVLDMLRTRKIMPNAEVTNLLLTAFDTLRDMVNNTGSVDDIASEDILSGLDSLASSYTAPAEKAALSATVRLQTPDGSRIFELPEQDVLRADREGRNLYWIELDFVRDIERRGVTLIAFFRILLKYGEILESKVDFEAVGGLEAPVGSTLPVRIIAAVSKDLEGVQSLLYTVEADQIHVLERVATEAVAPVDPGDNDTPIADSQPSPEAEPALPNTIAATSPHQNRATAHTAEQNTVADNSLKQNGVDAASLRQGNPPAKSTVENKPPSAADESIRINVRTLEMLMNLAGELVLSRNQLRTAVTQKDEHALGTAEQRINQVTSELQDVIMQTRLQPIGNVFNKFPRVIRDLSRQLGKDIDLQISGNEVALDKSLIEGIGDPLMHMVRNAADHGIESPGERQAAGKPATGVIHIEARHEAGQVIIEIRDDGKGIDAERITASSVSKGLITAAQAAAMNEKDKLNLIFQPGLSTAKTVSDVSGRGVGMDVVKTNLIRLGGQVEIQTQPGAGTLFRIKLPLTLAIIPTLIVSAGRERFAIPQSSIKELVSIRADEMAACTDVVGSSEVLILREEVIPLVRIRSLLQIEGDELVEKRIPTHEIVVLTDGSRTFAVEFDWLHTTEEVVVKPLGKRLKHLTEYAGATILGDGSVAMILDTAGLARKASIYEVHDAITEETQRTEAADFTEAMSVVLFGHSETETCAILLDHVERIERIRWDDVESKGKRRTMQYRGGMLPLYQLDDVAAVSPLNRGAEPVVLVSQVDGKTVGLLGTMPVNVVHLSPTIDVNTHRQSGITGSMIVEGQTILLCDTEEIVHSLRPVEHRTDVQARTTAHVSGTAHYPGKPTGNGINGYDQNDNPVLVSDNGNGPESGGHITGILLAEDSDFFRSRVKQFIMEAGYRDYDAPDGEQAWSLLLENLDAIQLVVTDIEMPELDGLELTSRIRSDHRTAHLPVIAVSSLAAEEDITRGYEAGVTEYQIKLDRGSLIDSIRNLTTLEPN